jgi:hypothetical protein
MLLHNETLLETVERGKDATGIALSMGTVQGEQDNFWLVLKQPVTTYEFFENRGQLEKYKTQDKCANTETAMRAALTPKVPLYHVLGHTRKKTQGTEYDPHNNHPIIVGNIIGIHNGCVKNSTEIYKKHAEMTPQGTVDSEAIIQLLAEIANDRALGEEDIEYVTERIEGPRAVIAYNNKYPDKVVYFHDKERPLELAHIKELGIGIICSERSFLHMAIKRYNMCRLVYPFLPSLSLDWRAVPAGKGGIIDIAKHVSPNETADDIYPLVECADTLKEYKNTYSNVTHSTTYYPPTNHHNTCKKKKEDEEIYNSYDVIGASETSDLSDYGEDANEPISEVVVSGRQIEDAVPFDSDEITREYIHDFATSAALGNEVKEDQEVSITKYKGRYVEMLGDTSLTERKAEELAHNVFPEIFVDGYLYGYRDSLDAMKPCLEDAQTNSISGVEERKNLRENLRRASNIIANLKGFILASIISGDIADVEGSKLVFDQKLQETLKKSKKFNGVKLDKVAQVFKKKDCTFIRESKKDRNGSENDNTSAI